MKLLHDEVRKIIEEGSENFDSSAAITYAVLHKVEKVISLAYVKGSLPLLYPNGYLGDINYKED